VFALKMLVDEGEAEAIALAYETNLKIILDDRQARKVARNMKVSFIGTIGILIQAKQKSIIQEIKPLLDNLEKNNFYLSKNLKQEALTIVKEI
jgi:predicted nucleic acid-binding protein